MKEKIKIYTRPMKAQKAGNNDSGSRRKKLMRFFGASSLAIIMGAGVLCGTILAPLATHTNTSAGDDPSLTAQEQLLAGTLELDPENDPVIYTTDYGLDIKWHMAGLPANSNDIVIMPDGQKFPGYAYINHANVNWVIIGYSNKTVTLSGVINLSPFINYYSEYSNSDYNMLQSQDSDAATEIYDAHTNSTATFYGDSSTAKLKAALFPNAKATGELETNEVLCFAQNIFSTTSKFNDSSNYNCYYNSRLMTTINTFYDEKLKAELDNKIVSKTLKTVWSGASDKTNGSNLTGTYKIFPLAGANENESFYVFNYLMEGDDALPQSTDWWLRSGYPTESNYVSCIYAAGHYDVHRVTLSYGVRPAFVLKI
ncbi:MAG: hypothetical protein J6A98_02510 [Clostridia bacterium]|nr:hypothetical protein [Clostridia bacterium]